MKPRAPFRYWGGKVRMAPWIVERLPDHNHFIEGCAGSASVMAVKPPVDLETINDVYSEVLNFWRVLRDPVLAAQLIDDVAFTPYHHDEFRKAGEMLEASRRDDGEPCVLRAWAFFVRMQMAVVPGRSGWSYSVSGPSGRKANKPGRWSTMPELLRLTCQRFDRVQITNYDIIELIERFDKPGVLHFVDMPYLDDSRPNSVGTYEHDEFPHEAFLDAVRSASHASFAVTHYPHPFYDDGPWTSFDDYQSHRNIPNGEGRAVATERLYILDRENS